MGKIITPIVVLCLLVWMVLATTKPNVGTMPLAPMPAMDAFAGVADDYVECAAYYRLTARYLAADGDGETSIQYDERAAVALDQAQSLSARNALELSRHRDSIMASMGGHADQPGHGLGELGVRYDEDCLALLDG